MKSSRFVVPSRSEERTLSPWWFVAATGLSVVVVAAGVGNNGGRVAGAVLWALAFLGVGILVGFIFGIPKVVQKADQPSQSQADAYEQRVNTSLEQVSDWLTKGLIGVGLVELKNIPEAVSVGATYLEPTLQLGPAVGAPFAAAIIVTFFIQGFLTGYLFTRLHLARLFSIADRGPTTVQKESVAEARVQANEMTSAIPQDVVRVAERLAATPIDEVKPEDVAVWAKAQLIDGNSDEALVGYKRALQLHPEDDRLHLEYATVLFRAGRAADALRELQVLRSKLGDKGDPDLIEQVYAWLTYISLWEPNGFKETIRLGEEYLARGLKPSGEIYANLAAAQGQKARPLPPDDPAFEEAAKAALGNAKSALDVDPQWRQRLRQLMYPNEPGRRTDDDDLQPFNNRPDFQSLLGVP